MNPFWKTSTSNPQDAPTDKRFIIIEAIESSNLKPGIDVNIALDCAASEFFDGKNYILRSENKKRYYHKKFILF